MIRFAEIEKLSSDWGVPTQTVEKDYCLTWILLALAGLEDPMPVVFYGGTALKKAYMPDYRFSEDLDFIVTKNEFFDPDRILGSLQKSFEFIARQANIYFGINDEMSSGEAHRFQCFVRYDGFAQITSEAKQIKMDFLFGYDQLIPPVTRKILGLYSDMIAQDKTLAVYTLEAVLADKLAAVLDSARNEPRDIYDIWMILKMGTVKHDQVKESLKKRLGFWPALAALRPNIENPYYESRWKTRLNHQIVGLPEFDRVKDEIFALLEGF